MVYELTYYLEIDPNHYFEILSALQSYNFSVSDLRPARTPIEGNPDSILCTQTVSNDQIHKGLEYVSVFLNIPGIISVIPMPRQRITWKDIVPISVSTAITFLVTLSALYQLVETPSIQNILTISGIPTAVTFLAQLLYRFLK